MSFFSISCRTGRLCQSTRGFQSASVAAECYLSAFISDLIRMSLGSSLMSTLRKAGLKPGKPGAYVGWVCSRRAAQGAEAYRTRGCGLWVVARQAVDRRSQWLQQL